MSNLTVAEAHFAFGENWKSFLSLFSEARVEASDAGVRRLFPNDELRGARVLDIGCGSGLPALSLARLGASRVDCIDIDAASVEATTRLLASQLPHDCWSARAESLFELGGAQYDVVHGWGVLHHTGDMWRAIERAAALVNPSGLLAIAIYQKTPLCGWWKFEKRAYSVAPKVLQNVILHTFKACCLAAIALRGGNPFRFVREYQQNRGMDWNHDLHDWLGGYPYESASTGEIERFLAEHGFRLERSFLPPRSIGLSGTGCMEHVFKRIS